MKKRAPQKSVHQYFWWTLLIATTGAPFIAIYGQWFGYLPELHITSWFTVITPFLWGCFFLGYVRNRQWSLPKLLLPLFLFIVWLSCSLLWAISLYEGLYEWLQWTAAALLGLLILQCMDSTQRRNELLLALSISGTLCATIGILQYWFDINWVQQGVFPASTLFNRNITNQYLVLCLPACWFLLFTYKHPRAQIALGLCAALMVTYVFYSTTRAAALVVVIQGLCLIIWLLITLFKSKETLTQGARIPAIITFIITGLLLAHMGSKGVNPQAIPMYLSGAEPKQISQMEPFDQKLSINIDQLTEIAVRKALWLNSLSMIKNNPVAGVGLGNWNVVYPKYHLAWMVDPRFSRFASPTNTHQDWLQITAELGIIGLVLLLWVLINIILLAKKILPSAQGLAFILVLTAIIIESSYSFPLQLPMTKLAFILWIILAAYHAQIHSPNSASYSKIAIRNSTTTLALGLILLITTLPLFKWQQNWYLAEVANRKATADKRYNRYDVMLKHAEQSVSYNPLRKRLWHFVAIGNDYQKKPAAALQAYEKQLQDYPYMLFALYQAANAHIQLGQTEQAQEKIQRYLALRPIDAEAQKFMGVLLFQYLKQPQASLPYFEEAIALDPDIADANEIKRLIASYKQ